MKNLTDWLLIIAVYSAIAMVIALFTVTSLYFGAIFINLVFIIRSKHLIIDGDMFLALAFTAILCLTFAITGISICKEFFRK